MILIMSWYDDEDNEQQPSKVNDTMSEVVESEDSIQHWERVLALADLMLRWPISWRLYLAGFWLVIDNYDFRSSHYLVIQVKEKLAVLYGEP